MRKTKISSVLLILFTLFIPQVGQPDKTIVTVRAQGTSTLSPQDTSQLITSQAVGRPAAGGHYLFWVEKQNGTSSINKYDLNTNQTELVSTSTERVINLASDGQTLVWVEGTNNGDGIMAYDLTSRQISKIVKADQTSVQGIAVDGGVLYYSCVWSGTGVHGLFGRNLATGVEQLVSNFGREPVGADGKVLWVEEQQSQCSDSYPDPETGSSYKRCQSNWDLHLLNGGSDKKIASSTDALPYAFSGYHVSGNKVVWSQNNQTAYLYDLTANTQQDMSGKPVNNPLISGNTVVWTIPPSGKMGAQATSSIEVADVGGVISPAAIVKDSSSQMEGLAIAQQSWLVFTVRADRSQEAQELRITSLASRGLSFPGSVDTWPSDCSNPLNCGQVYRQNTFLYEAQPGQRWTANGVAFFLPDHNINAQTFRNDIYWPNRSEIIGWLDKAVHNLHTSTIRIFVDLTGDAGRQGSDIEAVRDFAGLAGARGMRIGVVLHDSNDLTLSQNKANWITQFLISFSSHNQTALIAYISAANEINNYCSNSQRALGDCFDVVCLERPGVSCTGFNQAARIQYVDDAGRWVNWVAAMLATQNSHILLTVGISTEMTDLDTVRPEADFFRQTLGNYPSIATYADFLSPHNYGGGGISIYNEIRARDTSRPIVLEEFGYPTDPWSADLHAYKEGCWDPNNPYDPALPPCPTFAPVREDQRPSASGYVEDNAYALRSTPYAGGVAWMLTDMTARSCSSVSDYFTGLLWGPVDVNYCQGTYSNIQHSGGQTKATAYRVLLHNCTWPTRTCGFDQMKP